MIYNKEQLEQIPTLDDGRVYIYVLRNTPDNNIKIGKTTSLPKRIQSLSGSNAAGNKIVEWYCSPATYLYTLERACHTHFDFARFPDSEWFDGTKVSFDEAVAYLKGLFASEDYYMCNELRAMSYCYCTEEEEEETTKKTFFLG